MATKFSNLIWKTWLVAKFGGSAIGPDGLSIPIIIQRITDLKKDSKIVIAVFSAPLTMEDGKTRSLTDIILELGKKAETGDPIIIRQGKKNI